MANGNSPQGLIPRRLRNGSPWHGPVRTYYVPASDANAMFVGDPVIIAGSGDVNGYPSATLATAATGRITGVIVGIRPDGSVIPQRYRPASTVAYIQVVDDPDVLYEIQEDAVGGALTADSIGLNASLIAAAGSTAMGTSGWMLDSSTAATTNTLQLRIVELQHRPDNELGANAKWLVAINLPTETGAAGSTGV